MFFFMLPMFVVVCRVKTAFLVSLGQVGFFFSSLFLPAKLFSRIIMGALILCFGLGFYLIGGAVAPNSIMAIIFTFMICLNLSYLTSWKVGGPLALTLVMIYTAGLNTGSPERATATFYVFAFVLGWSVVVVLLPFWHPIEPPNATAEATAGELTQQGLKMGIGASLALAISYVLGFAKLGWAPSAVGNVVRYDNELSKKRAWARFVGTIGGSVLAGIVLALISSIYTLIVVAGIFAVLNGFFKKTKIGMMPLFYTGTILLLYSANDVSAGATNISQRIAYNLVGIGIGLFVVMYPFPKIMKRVNQVK